MSAELYDPSSNRWSATGRRQQGQVLRLGSYSCDEPIADAELYTP